MDLSVSEIVGLHDRLPAQWEHHAEPAGRSANSGGPMALAELVAAAHFANFTIWNLEDEARRRDVGDARIAALKRSIDPWNQRRNDLMESVDAAVLAHFAQVDVSTAELHSETAGMMVDRLSILALKIRSMERVAADATAQGDSSLADECGQRAATLRVQRQVLADCLARLLEDFAGGRRHFQTYRQLKAYNDPRLNPALRGAAGKGES